MVLAHVETTVDTTSPLIGPRVGWRAAVSVAVALIHARPWGRKKKRNTWRVVLVELLSVSHLSLHTLALTYIFPAKAGSTQRQPDNVASSFSA